MSPVSPRRQGGPSWPLLFVAVVGLMLVVVAAFFIFVLVKGEVTVPFTDPPRVISFTEQDDEPEEQPPPEGYVAVPVLGRSVTAYTKINRDDMVDMARQRLAVLWLPADIEDQGVLMDPGEIIGRVLAHPKRPGYVFTEADFLPKGTRPGLVAGIPPGMRSMRVKLEDVRGFYGLNPGDRFDVVSTLAVEGDAAKSLGKHAGVFAGQMAAEAAFGGIGKQANVKVIVQNGIVVSGVETIQVPISSASLTRGSTTQNKPVQELVIAMAPVDVARFTEAVSVGADLSVIGRSGHPDDDANSITPSLAPKTPFSDGNEGGSGGMGFVDTISGDSRAIVPVPRKKNNN